MTRKQPEQYLTLTQIAERAGITPGSARIYHKRAAANRAAGDTRAGDLPAPDITLGRTPGWSTRTIDTWLTARARRHPPV